MTGQELRNLRHALNLSTSKCARQVEVSSRTWARWEDGSRRIPDGSIKLFRMLNASAIEKLEMQDE
jgi:DNA-binding transcriptional regulator YiaG